MVNAFKIWTNGFPDGQLLLTAATTSRHPPVRVTRRQDATKALQDRLRVVPTSRIKELDLLKVAADSFVFVACELVNDKYFCPSSASCKSLPAFKFLLDRLDLRNFSWCVKSIDDCLK
ncbi:hypothetical protein RvY_15223 [Ramazzottius varieornatus]|uniref:Uncharacterized protein n=1 Tax=Ramazzottius varieornatus TaxID=947166 RepID=A0A1D1VU52_RAMVA|nr:hypothetical protein RvY_15223 [Ramazzottius varieornatus]